MRTTHRTWKLLLVLLSVFALIATACGDDDGDTEVDPGDDTSTTAGDSGDDTSTTAGDSDGDTDDEAEVPDGPTIVIGAQDFPESEVLSQVYGQALEAAGYPVDYQALGGFREIVFSSFESGDINFTLEYAASALEFLNEQAGEATGDAEETSELLRGYLEDEGLVALEASPAVDSNAFVVTQETADELGLSSVSDLTEDLTLGGPPDCPENPFCIPGLIDVYGIDLSDNFESLDGAGPLTVAALEGGEIDVAILFSTNPQIAEQGWVVLEDDQGLINADNIIPVMSQQLVDAYGDDFENLVNDVSASLDTESVTELNRQFEIDLQDADVVAEGWLEQNGFL